MEYKSNNGSWSCISQCTYCTYTYMYSRLHARQVQFPCPRGWGTHALVMTSTFSLSLPVKKTSLPASWCSLEDELCVLTHVALLYRMCSLTISSLNSLIPACWDDERFTVAWASAEANTDSLQNVSEHFTWLSRCLRVLICRVHVLVCLATHVERIYDSHLQPCQGLFNK